MNLESLRNVNGDPTKSQHNHIGITAEKIPTQLLKNVKSKEKRFRINTKYS